MQTALGSGHHKRLVFNSPGPQQHLPMRLARGEGKSAWHQQQIGTRARIAPVQLGEPKVVANAHADAPHVPIARGQLERHGLLACLQHARFVVTLLPVVKSEKMNLVVPRHTAARRREHQRAVVDLLDVRSGTVRRYPVNRQRQGSAHDPQTQ